MKQRIISSLKLIGEDRFITVLLGLFVLCCLISLIYVALSVQPSDLQVVVHYTSYGTTNFYRDRWYYLLAFGGFIILMAFSHIALAYRLLISKGRDLTIAFIWLGFILLAISLALFSQILKVASLS